MIYQVIYHMIYHMIPYQEIKNKTVILILIYHLYIT